MSYQVLARKWRPKSFHTLVGQEHVLKALVNALDSDRLHHAYLFTGTRGVGKTTISRILAKCLNCEAGVSSTPCGQCSACVAIDEGRFVDLIEVDAASRTKVEDTRELLDNVQYRPTAGRYKVYLIDEVHMLSNHSFNALLKTLEEPPPHVKFLLATTDPQKLPVTILSRCLKFHLKNLTPERIEGHLAQILGSEAIPNELPALRLIARSAQGSMRDALSLLDQAIAHGDGRVSGASVREMLGVIDQDHIYRLLDALAALDGPALLAALAHCAEFSPDFEAVLNALLSLLHRIAVLQAVPDFDPALFDDGEQVRDYAARLSPEDVQLYYQIGLHGRRDLPLAPEPREGLEMTLLRMLAFRPDETTPSPKRAAPEPRGQEHPGQVPRGQEPAAGSSASGAHRSRMDAVPESTARASAQAVPEAPSTPACPPPRRASALAQARAAIAGEAALCAEPVSAFAEPVKTHHAPKLALVESRPALAGTPPWEDEPLPTGEALALSPSPLTLTEVEPEQRPVPASPEPMPEHADADDEAWWSVVERLPVAGAAQQMAMNCVLQGREGGTLHLQADKTAQALQTPARVEALREALSRYYGEALRLEFSDAPDGHQETPAERRRRQEAERLLAATQSLENDPVVMALRSQFGAQIVSDSIKAL